MEKTAVTVKIFNDEYTLKTDLPRTDVDAIAAMVDLAGELYTLRREYEALLKAAKDI